MPTTFLRLVFCVLMLCTIALAAPREQSNAPAVLLPAAVTASAPAGDEPLYSDPDAQSSATVTQVLPNSQTAQLILTNVRSIHIRQGILVINWGGSATTLLPNQYVTALTVNKRAAAASAPAAPAQP